MAVEVPYENTPPPNWPLVFPVTVQFVIVRVLPPPENTPPPSLTPAPVAVLPLTVQLSSVSPVASRPAAPVAELPLIVQFVSVPLAE